MEELTTFLARHPPFEGLDRALLEKLAATARRRAFETGEVALVEDGPPAEGLWVVLEGAMALEHQGEVIQVLEPGECFGQASLLTGMAPTFTVRAREPSLCALLEPGMARRALATEAGTAFLASSLRRRLVGTGRTVHGLRDLATAPVSTVMRPARFCPPGEPLREAARRLQEEDVGALLIELERGRIALLSDSEVRAALAGGLSTEAPARAAARSGVPLIPASQPAIEAIIDMSAAGSEHAAVVREGRICGIISAADLLGLEARGPIALRRAILEAGDEQQLRRVAAQLPQLFLLLLRAGVPPDDLGRVLSLQQDALVERLVELAIRRRGPTPTAWAWLDLGSAARRELTLASDQDNALAYGDPEPGTEAAVDEYFRGLAVDVNEGLVGCGLGLDNSGVVAGASEWRMSRTRWLLTFERCLHEPDESQLVRATVAFDFREAAGGLEIAAALSERIRAAREHPQLMRLIGRSASGYPVALTRRGQLAFGRGGAPRGRLDLKRGAVIPLVNVVRFHALANGVTISPTADRLEAIAALGGLERAAAEGLGEAFRTISRLRFEHHGAQIAAGSQPDNLLDAQTLSPIAAAELREALQLVRRAQRRLAAWLPSGT